MKYRVANTENIMEYGLKGLVSSLPWDEWFAWFSLAVNPKAGLSKARTFFPVIWAKGFIARFHEKIEAPKPCNKIIGKFTLLLAWGGWELVPSSDRFVATDSASYTLWCICTPLNSQKQLSGSARIAGSCNSSWSIPAICLFRFGLVPGDVSGLAWKN